MTGTIDKNKKSHKFDNVIIHNYGDPSSWNIYDNNIHLWEGEDDNLAIITFKSLIGKGIAKLPVFAIKKVTDGVSWKYKLEEKGYEKNILQYSITLEPSIGLGFKDGGEYLHFYIKDNVAEPCSDSIPFTI